MDIDTDKFMHGFMTVMMLVGCYIFTRPELYLRIAAAKNQPAPSPATVRFWQIVVVLITISNIAFTTSQVYFSRR